MPSWEDFKPFIVTGLALGGVYALSGVGTVVLYRATGVLNLAFGAVGAMGAFISWSLIDKGAVSDGVAFLICVLFGGVRPVWTTKAESRWPTGWRSARRWRRAIRWSRPPRPSASR